MLLGLSTFSVFFSHVLGFAGAGGLCALVLAFMAALGWKTDKVTDTGSASGRCETQSLMLCVSRPRWLLWLDGRGTCSSLCCSA